MADLNSLYGGGGRTLNQQEFTTDGTWVRPSGVGLVFVTAIGGGGGGSFGNGNPGLACNKLPMTVTGNLAVTVGTSGTAGIALSSGGDSGGNTVIGSLVLNGGAPSSAFGTPGSAPAPTQGLLSQSYPMHVIWQGTAIMQKAAGQFFTFGGTGAFLANSGRGGNASGVSGSSGYVLIEWFT